MKNIEKTISSVALELVKGQQQKKAEAAEYRTFCEGFPALLRSAGLAQTAAFLRAKGGHPHGVLYGHLETQFRRLEFLGEKEELLETLVTPQKTSMPQYRLYSQIAMRVAHWHKRLAQALLEKKK